MKYSNTQRAPLGLILYTVGIVILVAPCLFEMPPFSATILVVTGLLILGTGLMFGHLTVRDEGENLMVRYGPLPMFYTSIRYADVTNAQRDRTSVVDGWGIHYVPWRGWTYNLWGFDCVKISIGERIIRVGTDDPDNLTEFLRTKITRPDRP
jgi:hypothetical protein